MKMRALNALGRSQELQNHARTRHYTFGKTLPRTKQNQ
jgi:hypothetical protein